MMDLGPEIEWLEKRWRAPWEDPSPWGLGTPFPVFGKGLVFCQQIDKGHRGKWNQQPVYWTMAGEWSNAELDSDWLSQVQSCCKLLYKHTPLFMFVFCSATTLLQPQPFLRNFIAWWNIIRVGYRNPVLIWHQYVLEPNQNTDFSASFRCHAWAIGWNICPLFLRNRRKKHHHRTWMQYFLWRQQVAFH